jgi:hypothetical protein
MHVRRSSFARLPKGRQIGGWNSDLCLQHRESAFGGKADVCGIVSKRGFMTQICRPSQRRAQTFLGEKGYT